jgi:transposase
LNFILAPIIEIGYRRHLMEAPTMKTLPAEFRHRVIALTDDGMTTREIAEVLGVSGAWVRSINALHKSGASIEPKSRANRRTTLAQREGDRIRSQVAAKPGTTLEDLRRDLGLETSIANLWIALRELKIRLKKKRSTPPSRPGPTSPPTAPSGRCSPPASTRAASSSSTRPSAPRT